MHKLAGKMVTWEENYGKSIKHTFLTSTNLEDQKFQIEILAKSYDNHFQTIHEAHDMQTNGYLVTMLGDPETVLTRCATALINGQVKFQSSFRGQKSGLVVSKLNSQFEGRGFEFHPMLDGNGVKAMPWIDYCTQSWFI